MTDTIAVLMTCHNRAQKTLRCLEALYAQKTDKDIEYHIFLVDDGSTDNTSEAVKSKYPQAIVIRGNGSLFWNRGMHLAFETALKTGFDFYLWLNDDTFLYTSAVDSMLSVHASLAEKGEGNSIVAASTKDPDTKDFSYGGYRLRKNLLNPLDLYLVEPEQEAIPVVTFCGNCVLIPEAVADLVGNMDPVYQHRWGDVDYGLQAREKGCGNWMAPGYQGECDVNPNADRWRDAALPLKERITELHSLKGVGKDDWKRYTSKHGGTFWLLVWIRPYLRVAYDTFKL